MSFWGDDRAASVQIGAVLLFGFIIASMAIWQATVVPQENARVEYTHSQRAQDDMQNVRNSIISASGGGNAPSVGVDMAPEYPPRSVFVNPGPPTGTVRTVGTSDPGLNLTVANATAVDDDAADYWDGSAHAYGTGGLVYEPNYNVYTGAPVTVYENTVLYNQRAGQENVTLAGQNLVDGTTISLVALNGSLSQTRSGTFTVDPKKLSSSTRTVSITDATGNVTVSFASRQPANWWRDRLSGELTGSGGNVVDVRSTPLSDGFHNVTLELAGGETYRLRMTKVGLGSGTARPSASYATDVAGNGSSVAEGGTQQVVVEVRDRYNNPVSGVTVNASVSPGSLTKTQVTTDGDGRAVFTYEAPDNVDSERTARLNLTFEPGVSTASSSFDPDTTTNATATLFVQNSDGSGGGGGGGGGGGAYSIDWRDPDTVTAGETTEETLGSCSATDCTWNVSASGDSDLVIEADTSPTVESLNTEFAVSNSSVASVSPSSTTTDANGVASTTLNANANGTVKVYVVTGDSSAVVNLTLTNVQGVNGPPTAKFTHSPKTPETGTTVEFDPSASTDPEGNISEYRWDFDGDGTVEKTRGSATNVTWSYSQDGNFDATLTVVDNVSNTDTKVKTVSVQNQAPGPSFTANCSRLNCTFDASGSTDADGSITGYDWEFGDGTTATGQSVTHTYSSAGTYTANLTVTDDDGATNTTSTTITVSSNDAPTADIFANETTVATGETVGFDGLNSSDPDGSISSYEWSFGDGSANATGSSVTNSYIDDGTYEVVLTVTDNDGATDSTSVNITVTNRPPTANFTYSPSQPIVGNSVSFDASNATDLDGGITSYEWDWNGDGTYDQTTTSATISHTFSSTGTYNVTLRVTDNDGDTAVTSKNVQVIGGRIELTYVTSTSNGNQLRAIDRQGRITYFNAGGSVARVGPASADLDGDGFVEATYVTSSGYIELIDRNNETQTLLNSVSAKKGAITVGSWQGSGTAVFYANNNDQGSVFRKSLGQSGAGTKVADFGSTSIKGVLGIGDIDDDGSDEIAVLTGSNTIGMVDQDGTTVVDKDGLTVASSSGPGVGSVADFNGDGADRIATIDGSNQVRLVECNTKSGGRKGIKIHCNGGGGTAQETVTLSPSAGAKKAPFGVANWTGDATPEVVYAENANSPAELYYVETTASDTVGTEGYVTDAAGSRIVVVIKKGVGSSSLSLQARMRQPD